MKATSLFLMVSLAAGIAGAGDFPIGEDPSKIAGGPRTQLDAGSCSFYRPTWEEFDHTVPAGVMQFGPEAPLPGFLNSTNPTAADSEGVKFWDIFSKLNAAYSGRRTGVTPTTAAGEAALAPVIGYDQLYIAWAIVNVTVPGQHGPLRPMPFPAWYRWVPRGVSAARAFRIDQLVWSLSFVKLLDGGQLKLLYDTLIEEPTCAGEPYTDFTKPPAR